MSGLTLPFEVVDGITLANLQEAHAMLKKEVKEHLETGSYMHPEDYYNSMTRLIPSLEVLIDYYGGDIV